MKIKFALLLFVNSLIFAQINSTDIFLQDVATVFTQKDGLPEIDVLSISIDNKINPIVVTKQGSYQFDGKLWKLTSVTKNTSVEGSKTIDIKFTDPVLSYVKYQDKFVIGTENGLFIQKQDEDLARSIS